MPTETERFFNVMHGRDPDSPYAGGSDGVRRPPQDAQDPEAGSLPSFTLEEVTLALVKSLEQRIVLKAELSLMQNTLEHVEKYGNALGITANYLLDVLLARPCECWEETKCWRCEAKDHAEALLMEHI